MSEEQPKSLSRRILEETIAVRTRDQHREPRVKQAEMHEFLAVAASAPGAVASAEGPTGIGKSYTYLSHAAAASLERGCRTLISTEFIKLQAQLMGDFEDVRIAIARLGYEPPKMAAYKGLGNYVCRAAAEDEGEALRDELNWAGTRDDFVQQLSANPNSVASLISPDVDTSRRKSLNGRLHLLAWASSQDVDADDGDMSGYEAPYGADPQRDRVSVSGEECPGTRCRFADECFGRRAKKRAAEADVVVTNHVMLAVQAAHGAPAALGNPALGDFDLVVVDEAHSLPDKIREQSERHLSFKSVTKAVERAQSAVGDYYNLVAGGASAEDRREIAELTESVNQAVERYRQDIGVRLLASLWELSDGPLWHPSRKGRGLWSDKFYEKKHLLAGRTLRVSGDLKEEVTGPLLKALDKVIERVVTGDTRRKAVKARNTLRGAVRLVDVLNSLAGNEPPSVVAWLTVEKPEDGWFAEDCLTDWKTHVPPGLPVKEAGRTAIAASRIEIGVRSAKSLWRAPAPSKSNSDESAEDPEGASRVADESATPPRRDRSIVLVSGTLPVGIEEALGLLLPGATPNRVDLDNPDFVSAESRAALVFADYDASLRASRARAAKAARGGRLNHNDWLADECETKIPELVRANGGRALVLVPKQEAGERYVTAIEAHCPNLNVYSQWGPLGTNRASERWLADPAPAVLVGTKSYMTGLDAKGETCTLVIIERAPRKPGNAVFDALGQDSYIEDAVTHLRQSLGRLIRTPDDMGTVVFLDPRFSEPSGEQYRMRSLVLGRSSNHYQVRTVGWGGLLAEVTRNRRASERHFQSAVDAA